MAAGGKGFCLFTRLVYVLRPPPAAFGSLIRRRQSRARAPAPHKRAHWYGIIRNTLARSPSLTRPDFPSFRFRFLAFEVSIWRSWACPRFTFPVAVFLKRLAAPLWVFSFGMSPQNQLSVFSRQPSEIQKSKILDLG